MWYKVINTDNLVIDVLDFLNYVKFQENHRILISCNKKDAQGILSSDQTIVWHLDTLQEFPSIAPIYDTVRVSEISEEVYYELKRQLEIGEQPVEPPLPEEDEKGEDTSTPLTLRLLYSKVQENTTDIDSILGKYDADKLNLTELQYYRQEENKANLAEFLQKNPILWNDGNYYGVTHDDQNEMIADKAAYELKQAIGQTDWKLEWHNTKHACREFTVEEFAALLNSIIDFVYPYRRLQEAYKEMIFSCTSKEQLLNLNLEYSAEALKTHTTV